MRSNAGYDTSSGKVELASEILRRVWLMIFAESQVLVTA